MESGRKLTFDLAGSVGLLLLLTVLTQVKSELKCLADVDAGVYPTCKIVDHGTHGGDSFECLPKWGNSIFLHKDGNITLDCSAPFPIDMDYEGVKPIMNLHIEFYKKLGESGASVTFGVKVDITAKLLEYSGDYIFHPLGEPDKKVTIYVFAEKRDLPQFLDLIEGKPILDAYIDPAEPDAIVIPCRTANFNASILGVYYDFEDLKKEIDGVKLRYDPRKGFIRKIPPPDTEDGIYGTYECYTEWKASGRDRKKVLARAPPSDDPTEDYGGEGEEEEEEETTTKASAEKPNMTHIPDLITFTPLEDKKFKAECTLPVDIVRGHTPFFGNAVMQNPTSARLNLKCSHIDSNCGENIRILGTVTKPPNNLEIPHAHASGLVQCTAGLNTQILEYFTGADDQIYFDWNEALAKNGLVKVIPAENYTSYTIHKNYSFTCVFPKYVAVLPVWWGMKYENGTMVDSFEYSSTKSFDLDMDSTEIHCGVSIWNETTWYNASMPIKVVDFVLPVMKSSDADRRKTFKSNEPNQVLRCDVEHTPNTKLEWFRQGKKIEDIPTLDMGDSLVLFFQEINSTYVGNYTCRASSKSTFVEAEYQVVLDDTPTIKGEDEDDEESLARKRNKSCKGIGEMTLHHRDNGSEVASLEDINSSEILVLRFSPQLGCGGNQSAAAAIETILSKSQILVKVYDPNEVASAHPGVPIHVGQGHSGIVMGEPHSGLGGGHMPFEFGTTGYTALGLGQAPPEDIVGKGESDGNERGGGSSSGRSVNSDPKRTNHRPLYNYLLPLVFGLTVALVLLITAFVSYSYFAAPWKSRKISIISSNEI